MKPLFPLAAPLLVLTAAAPAPPVNPDLQQVQRHFQTLGSMTATFTQTDREGKELTGTLTMKQPGRLRFQYQKGVPILIVADGGALTFIDYSVRQVQRWPIRNSPLGVLLDPTRDIGRYAQVVPSASNRTLSVDARDPKHPEYGRITLVFNRDAAAPAGLSLAGWVQLDSQNNRTTIRLSGQRFGVPIAGNAFAWTDPRRTAPRR